MCFNYAGCYAVAVYLCCQYTPGAREQGTALLLCVAVTNADYKTSPPKCAQKIGNSSKTRTRAGKVGAQQLPHSAHYKILYHQRCAIQRRLPRVAPCRVAGVTTKIIRSAGLFKAGHSVVRVQSREPVLVGWKCQPRKMHPDEVLRKSNKTRMGHHTILESG